MKATVTFFLAISFGTLSFAQQLTTETKVEVKALELKQLTTVKMDSTKEKDTQLARVYMFKNSRIKKALAFRTKRDRSKMA